MRIQQGMKGKFTINFMWKLLKFIQLVSRETGIPSHIYQLSPSTINQLPISICLPSSTVSSENKGTFYLKKKKKACQ